MSINHAGETFGGIETHGLPLVEDPTFQDQTEAYFGVYGSQEVTDLVKFRFIRLEVDLMGYSTFALLEAAIRDAEALINDLQGTLTINNASFKNCVFKAVTRVGPAQYVDGTLPGYMQSLILVWKQLNIA